MKRHVAIVWFECLAYASIAANFAQALASYWLMQTFASITFTGYFSNLIAQIWVGMLFAIALQLACVWFVVYRKNNPARFVYLAFVVLSAGIMLYSLVTRIPYIFFAPHPPVGVAGGIVLFFQFLQPALQIAAIGMLFMPVMNRYVSASKHAHQAKYAR